MTAPKPNAELAWRVLDHIDAHSEQHNQSLWMMNAPCGTVACLAGWACLLSGDRPVEDEDGDIDHEVWVGGDIRGVGERAAELLGIPHQPLRQLPYGHELFNPLNSREDLGRLVAEIFGPRPEPVLGAEMQPPPCADHAASELGCLACSVKRNAFYIALGREAS